MSPKSNPPDLPPLPPLFRLEKTKTRKTTTTTIIPIGKFDSFLREPLYFPCKTLKIASAPLSKPE